jgi:ligand-binding sensor domain-containing protein
VDARDRLWVGTARGLARIDDAGVHRYPGLPSDDIHALRALSDHTIAVGTARGLVVLDEQGRAHTIGDKQGLEGEAIWAIAEGPDALWIGTSRGLFRYDHERRKVRRLSMASGHLDEDWVTAIVVSGSELWAGTYSKGVAHLVADAKAPRGYRAELLGGGPVNVAGLALDGDTLLAATMDGLLRRADSAWVRLDRAAPGKDVTALAVTSGGLWVASRRGITFVE